MSRLIEILGAAALVNPRNEQQYPKSVREVWCEVFDLEDWRSEAALLDVLERLKQLRALFDENIEIFKNLDGINQELFVSPLISLRNIVGDLNDLNLPWESYVHYLSGTNMTSLRFAEDKLIAMGTFNEALVPLDELTEILSDASKLYEAVLNSDLPKSVKAIFLEIIKEFQDAIHEYRIGGAKRLKESVASAVSNMLANQHELNDLKGSDELKALANLVERVDNAYKLVKNVTSLIQTISSAMPLLGSGK